MSAPGKKIVFTLIAAGLLLAGGGYYWAHRNEESTDDAAIEAHVVPIASRVSGYVAKLNIVDNQRVKAGDVLLEVDPRDYQIALDLAHAQLDSANAAWMKSQLDLKRMQELHDIARSRQMLDDATAAERGAAATVEGAKATVAQAEKNLADTKVLAPFDGQVTKRSVEPGAYVSTGQQLLTIVSNDMWVLANYKETQLTAMKPGQSVDITIDAYPGLTYRGKVDSIQTGTGARFSAFPPENATGNFVKIVQRVPVKIVFVDKIDPSLAIGPGLSVEPVVHLR